MKKNVPAKLMVMGMLLSGVSALAQCVSITCPSNITAPADSGQCSAIVNFTAPAGVNTCGSTTTTTFNYTGPALQTFTVPPGVTSINIDASGAQGGSVTTNCAATGGLGARMVGDFTVTPGEVLSIMVGQQGLTNGSDAGGGGGTFVVRTGNVLLTAAGGGGGATNNIGSCGSNRNGVNATITTSGTASANGLIAGGINGNGGGASGGSGGGGGGFLTDGTAGTGLPGNNGKCYLNGGAGGTGNNNDFGGYGGGGAGWFTGGNGGGGGGYSGGGTSGSQPFSGGGGGGSYSIGTNQNNAAGFQSGNGRVILSYTVVGAANVTQIAGLASGAAFPVGTTTQTFAVTDGISSFDTCSFTITVQDMQAPAITCPSNIIVSNDAGQCGAVVTYSTPGASDNCGSPTLTQTAGLASGAMFPLGTTTISYAATDASGNTDNCSFTVTVEDQEAPVISCPSNMTVAADSAMCGAIVTYSTPTATDNCSTASVSLVSGPVSGSMFPVGTTSVSFSATDSAGNTSVICSFDIIVSDQEAPAFVCPGTLTVPADSGNCTAVVTFNTPAATDNCNVASVTQTGGPVSGSTFPAGTTTVTFTALDSAGNTSTCSFDIVVADMEAPSVTCPANVTSCTAAITGIASTATDLCSGIAATTYVQSGATTGSGSGDASGNYNVGTTTVTYTVTDSSGNSANCSFTVTVFPDPTLTVSASDNSVCLDDANVTLTGLPAGGTWSGPGVTGSSFDPSVGVGSQTLTYSYTDGNGCSNTAPVTVVVSACVGITETAGFEGLRVFPNPTSGTVNIQLGGIYNHVEYRLANLNGQLIRSEQVTKTEQLQLTTDDLPAGVYFLTIKADDQIKTVKLVKN